MTSCGCFTKRDTSIVKGCAILFMYFHHFYFKEDRYAGIQLSFFPLSEAKVIVLARFLKICVALFLFLSGYAMYKNAESKGLRDWKELWQFSIQRYIHILVPYMFVFLLIQLVCLPSGRALEIYGSGWTGLAYCIIDLFGLATAFQTPTFNGAWWYLTLISLLCWLFPLICRFYRWNPVISTIVMIFLSAIPFPSQQIVLYWMPPFWMGMAAAGTGWFSSRLASLNGLIHSKTGFWMSMIPAAVLCMLAIPLRSSPIVSAGVTDALIALLFVTAIFIWISRLPLADRILDALGAHSMTMYLIHSLIKGVYFREWSYGWENAFLNVLVFTMATYLMAVGIDWLQKKCHVRQTIHFLEQLIVR